MRQSSLKCGLQGLVLSKALLPRCPTDRAVEAQSFLPLFGGPLPSSALPSSTLSFTTPETGQGPSYCSSVSDPAGCQSQLESHPVLVLLSCVLHNQTLRVSPTRVRPLWSSTEESHMPGAGPGPTPHSQPSRPEGLGLDQQQSQEIREGRKEELHLLQLRGLWGH